MEELETAIARALTAALPGVDVRFDPYPGYGKLHAIIVWDRFEQQLMMDRHKQVWSVLKLALTDEQRHKTGFLVIVTPTEIDAMQEASLMDEAMDGIKGAA